MERYGPDVPTWIELRYCTGCGEFRPRICVERVLGSGPGSQSGDCVKVSTDDDKLMDSRALDWTNEAPVGFQKPATKYEPLFRRGL